jgi:hypothetical protein
MNVVKGLFVSFVLLLSALSAAVMLGRRAFARLLQLDVKRLFADARTGPRAVVTEEMLSELPAPIQRYLRYTGVVGRPVVHTVHLKQKGMMRTSPNAGSMPLDAEEWYAVEPPGFVWAGTLHTAGVPIGQARDMYRDGKGSMLIKLGAIFTLADAVGAEIDQGSMMRYFSEMAWFPTAFLGPNVSFIPIDDHAARATFSDRGRSVSATLHVDDEGRLTDFVAERYRMVGNRYELTPSV